MCIYGLCQRYHKECSTRTCADDENEGVFSDQQKAIHVQIQQKCDFDLITGDETYSIKGFIN